MAVRVGWAAEMPLKTRPRPAQKSGAASGKPWPKPESVSNSVVVGPRQVLGGGVAVPLLEDLAEGGCLLLAGLVEGVAADLGVGAADVQASNGPVGVLAHGVLEEAVGEGGAVRGSQAYLAWARRAVDLARERVHEGGHGDFADEAGNLDGPDALVGAGARDQVGADEDPFYLGGEVRCGHLREEVDDELGRFGLVLLDKELPEVRGGAEEARAGRCVGGADAAEDLLSEVGGQVGREVEGVVVGSASGVGRG